MIWRDIFSEGFVVGDYEQREGGYWEHECDREALQERELGLIDYISTNATILGMSSMSEHPRYPELIALQDKLYKPEE